MDMNVNPSDYRILIVDDVPSNILLLEALLGNRKFNLLTATSGQQALDIAKKEKPDLVLLDVMMPDMSGFEVAEKLKADADTAYVPILFLTALNATADIVRGFEVGGADFISKPFNKEELMVRVAHQLSLVSEKRVLMARMEELRKSIMGNETLYATIADELRAPLGSIKMVLNTLILNLPPEAIGQEMRELLVIANQTTEEVFLSLNEKMTN
jgi:two-component system sensor histidine kinase/response regulator